MSTVTVIHGTPDPDPMATMYRKVRDATYCNEDGVSNADKVAVLELVKSEIIRNMQARIDEE